MSRRRVTENVSEMQYVSCAPSIPIADMSCNSHNFRHIFLRILKLEKFQVEAFPIKQVEDLVDLALFLVAISQVSRTIDISDESFKLFQWARTSSISPKSKVRESFIMIYPISGLFEEKLNTKSTSILCFQQCCIAVGL